MGNAVPSHFVTQLNGGDYMFYNGKEFKPYDNYYYVSEDGDIYSTYKHGLLKHNIDLNGYHRVDIHGKHMKVHKLVYLTWCGEIPFGMQINHKDDNKDNNNYANLYIGTQKENVKDCIDNGHRVYHTRSITVFDKMKNEVIRFDKIQDLIRYTGHSCKSGSLNKIANKQWFNERFCVIE